MGGYWQLVCRRYQSTSAFGQQLSVDIFLSTCMLLMCALYPRADLDTTDSGVQQENGMAELTQAQQLHLGRAVRAERGADSYP